MIDAIASSFDKLISKMIVVIRYSGERTFPVCRELVSRQVPAERVIVVHEQPFELALRKTYEVGISSGAEWLITLDADVLPRQGALELLLTEAQAMPGNCFQLEGMVLDKLSGGFRQAGHRIYRTAFLERALELVPGDGETIRPESSTLKRMSELGYPSRKVARVFGIHDYEQYYRDIYRKAFVHAHKHQALIATFIGHWKSKASEDHDYQLALRGFCDGLMSTVQVRIDYRQYLEFAEIALKDIGVEEKSEFMDTGFDFVERTIAEAAPLIDDGVRSTMFRDKVARVKNNCRKMGVFRFLPYFLGSLLFDWGKKLKAVSRRN